MNPRSEAERILRELDFNFARFTVGDFIGRVGQVRAREIITIPWGMPATLFGAWISDGDEPKEYIFYRDNVVSIHQNHIQLHELSHFLFGHPTIRITREMIAGVVAGTSTLPFAELPQLRSPRLAESEAEAETLANLIQERAIRASQLDHLLHDTRKGEKLAGFLNTMGLA